MLISCFCAPMVKTRMVETTTEASGAPADSQNSLGFFML